MSTGKITIIATALLLLGPAVSAYEVGTHQLLSSVAVAQSALPQKVSDFGLNDLTQTISVVDTNVKEGKLVSCIASSARKLTRLIDLITLGSLCEDAASGTAQPWRFRNHFYDPQHNGQGLTFLGPNTDSLTWGVDPTNNQTTQEYSIRRAKDYMMLALTLPNEVDRQQNLGLMFRTVGHVIHLVQDAAQPQHTRNESHPLVHAFETWADKQNGALTLSGYPSVAVSTMSDFWHTASVSGLADYSSTGFVTSGANFIGTLTSIRPNPTYPLPNPAGAVVVPRQITDPDLLGPVGPKQHLTGQIYFIRTNVSDNYTQTSTPNPATSTYSLLDEDLQNYVGMDMHFSVNSFTFREAAKLLLPRAVGYSAGLINYFFRGSMRIAPPDEGVYAIVDHSPDDPAPSGCGTPCGFRKVKLKLMNTTPNQNMGSGKVIVVAAYHLNTCYQSDLSGEFGSAAYTANACRSAEEFIALSDPRNVPQVKTDFSDPALVFTFASPIPINATDLRFQVIFQGALGMETDAVAVSAFDIREPTYLIFGNHNDYRAGYDSQGHFAQIQSYQQAGPFSLNLQLRFAPPPESASQAVLVASSARLDPGTYHRLAILSDQAALKYTLIAQYFEDMGDEPEAVPDGDEALETLNLSLTTSIHQADAQGNMTDFPPFVKLRRTTAVGWSYESDIDGGAVYWVPSTFCVSNAPSCTPLDTTSGGIVRNYPPFAQPTPTPMTISF
ncbi:MAG TPA: hypothetical protein VGK37_12580 [Casimicrobiaceae bacterium]|jgi:hypothetical protein